jgi:hypothetical protein
MTDTVFAAWRHAWRDKALRVQIVATPLCLAVTLGALAKFLSWVETRPGTRLSDPVLAAFGPRDLTWFIFATVYLAHVLGLALLAAHPRAMLVGMQAYVVLLLARICVMYVTALDPPADMIALRDPLTFLGTRRMLTRDLFFSGHTSTLFVLFLAVPDRRLKPVLLACTVAVAIAVLWQHLHYTVDVLAAPVFAFASYRAVQALHRPSRGRS